ncbi:unnamed protein product [Ixodes hexagonus]
MSRRDRPLPQGTALSRMQDSGGGPSGRPPSEHPVGASARRHQEQPAAGRGQPLSPRERVIAGERPDWPRGPALPAGPSHFWRRGQSALFGGSCQQGRGGHPGSAHSGQAAGASDALRQGAVCLRCQGPRGPELPQGGPDSAAQACGPALAPRRAPGQAGLCAGQLCAGGSSAALAPTTVQGPVRLPHGRLRREGLPRLPQGGRHHGNPEGGRKLGRRKAGRTHWHLPYFFRRDERGWKGSDETLQQCSSRSIENRTPDTQLRGTESTGHLGQRCTVG